MNCNLKSILNVFSILFIVVVSISCKSTQSWTTKKEMKEIYIPNFKLTYFKTLLIAGYNNTNEIKSIVVADQSGYSESILSIEDYDLIDSLVQLDNHTMILDSINRIGKVAEGTEGKHVFGYALNKYQSNWLDKLSKERFKIYWRKEKQQQIE
jgi:hypothetical protein